MDTRTPQQHLDAVRRLLDADQEGHVKLQFHATNADESRHARARIAQLQRSLEQLRTELETDMQALEIAPEPRPKAGGLFFGIGKRKQPEPVLGPYQSVHEQIEGMLDKLEEIRLNMLFDYADDRDREEIHAILRARHMADLRGWKESGLVGHVMVVAAANACPSCKALTELIWSVDEAISKQPLPHEGCTNQLYGYCRCCYKPVVS